MGVGVEVLVRCVFFFPYPFFSWLIFHGNLQIHCCPTCYVMLACRQGAPSGIDGGRSGRYPANGAVRPKALWPVIGLRHPGDRVTMSSKWITSHGVDGAAIVRNNLAVDEILCAYERPQVHITPKTSPLLSLPQWFVEESFHECEYNFFHCVFHVSE